MAVCEPGKESAHAPDHGDTLIVDFLNSETVKYKCLLFEPPSLWYFVVAAGAKTEAILEVIGLSVKHCKLLID